MSSTLVYQRFYAPRFVYHYFIVTFVVTDFFQASGVEAEHHAGMASGENGQTEALDSLVNRFYP
jgi:hypothetical protein